MNNKTAIKITAAVAVLALGAVACESEPSTGDADKEERKVVDRQLSQYAQAQPVPFFNSSQLRQNLIEIQTAQVNATATTSFFFNLGVQGPVHACPSIGFPIPGTFQLTNPLEMQVSSGGQGGRTSSAIPQLESTGVYTGDTAATTVICIDGNGDGYAHYWEGNVSTVAGPAEWNIDTGSIDLVGTPSAEFSTGDE